MRPVLLDMHGFASFREAARVDFADADFFALVGPTGAGKSTVIDAMTFALYGSVPRWGRKGMVSLALAPTVARGTVKLVFEVAGQRYVVARELRRVGGTVSQRAASLERLADAGGLAAPGDVTFPLAKDLDGVNEAVEKLLGLKYEDFTQCVVLPQGQFAAFLHAKPSERQEILLRLLGAEHYRLMMAKANQRASVAAQRAATYGEELLGYADATPAAEDAARAIEDALASLGERVSTALPLIAARQAALQGADERLRRLRAEGAALSELRVPDGAGQLDAEATDARLVKLRDAIRADKNYGKAIGFRYHDGKPGVIEGLLSRGDRRVGKVIREVWERGGRFDGWSEHFSYQRWADAAGTALADTGVDLAWYTTREREYNEVLPWDHIDSGLDRDWLWEDWQDALEAADGGGNEVEDCRWTPCYDCGVCPQMGTEIQVGPTGVKLLPLTVVSRL